MAKAALRIAAAALVLAAAGCSGGFERSDCRGCNVVLVVVDTLRADHLGAYGYERDTSPNLDAFARENVLFTDSRAQSSCTYPSVNSILTSRYPEEFLDQPLRKGYVDMGIPEGTESVAETLSRAGYRTIGISGSPIVRNEGSFSHHNAIGGFERGFGDFKSVDCEGEHCSWVNKPHAEQINARVEEYFEVLEDLDEPFFLYLHYMDVHDPYAPPGEEHHRFSREEHSELDWVRAGNPNPIADMLSGRGGPVEYAQSDLDYLIALYDDEIAYFDRQFAELLALLERHDLRDDTLVVVTADHGEAFMEHGSNKHCVTLFDNEVKTPLLLSVPTLRGGAVRDQAVANLDVVPTILDYLEIEHDASRLAGRSLRPLIETGESPPALVYGSQLAYRSLTDGRFKLILDVETRASEVYDLAADPGETQPATHVSSAAADALRASLQERLVALSGDEPDALGEATRVGQETEAHLRAIGYLR